MTTEIDLRNFPGPQHYESESLTQSQKHGLPLAIFSLHVQLVSAPGNLLHSEQSKGYYFFRDASIPKPRPCTIAAWRRICCLGRPDSTQFYVPFLPSLREEDEVGSAIGERGSKIGSLSRKSKYHHVDSEDRIIWGPVYGGHLDSPRPVWQTHRSDFAESQVTLSGNWRMPATGESIRDRMVFLAQHGFPASNPLMKHLEIPRIYRLLFQILSRDAANDWVDAYTNAELLVGLDPESQVADFKEMVGGLVDARMSRKQDSSEEGNDAAGDSAGRNNIPKPPRFSDIDAIDF